MSVPREADALLVDRIRLADEPAWRELIERFEGRLLAYVEARLHDRAACEDVVQETFIGFLNSLPHYDPARQLESYLFTIAAHKLTDQLRRNGRRPTLPLAAASSGSESDAEVMARGRGASTLARSGERRHLEERAVVAALEQLIDHWRRRNDWLKIMCAELLLVRGAPNKEAARLLGMSEQQVANLKFDLISKLQQAVRSQGLSVDVFPELAEAEN